MRQSRAEEDEALDLSPGTQLAPVGLAAWASTSTRSGRIASLTAPVASSWPASAQRTKSPSRKRQGFLSSPTVLDSGVHQVRYTEEVGDVGIGGLVVDLLRRPELDDPSLVHDSQAIGHRERLFLIVGDAQEGDPNLLLQRTELDLEYAAELGVQRSQRLVEEQDRGAEHERTSEKATRCCCPPESWLGRRFS